MEDPFRWMLFGGLALITVGLSAGVFRAYQVIPRERVAAIAAMALIVAVSASWTGWVLVLVIDAVIAATLVIEHVRIET